ncbi:MAG: Hsp33 family molecular chaperone HslO [Alphaproteobacteria bacterium]|nr:Hsp33 family molecular chaperone HslO [Alphaproteobacteria bacterium]
MLQRLPVDKKISESFQENEIDDLWETAVILLHSATKEEMLDENLSLEKLLYRLYHSNNLHFFIQKSIQFGCRCSKDKVIKMLKSFSEQEQQEMAVDGKIKVDCQFCGKSYILTSEDL